MAWSAEDAQKPERGRFLREFGHATCSLHAGLRREAETQREFCSSLCPAELRLVALWTVVRPNKTGLSRRGCAVLMAFPLLLPVSDQGPLEPRDSKSKVRVVCPFAVCVCVCSHFASKAARREHQTNFDELDGLIAMVSCFHDSVLPAAHVGLFGISPCSEASEKDQVEEATTEALPGSLFLLVRASQFCVAPAGQSKLRSGGLREGSLTLAFFWRLCPLLQGLRNEAVDEALCGVSCLSDFRPCGVVGPGSFRRISMSLRGCLCRLNQHRPQPQSKMSSRLLLACHVCCGPLWAASERALGTPALGRIWMRQNDSEMWP